MGMFYPINKSTTSQKKVWGDMFKSLEQGKVKWELNPKTGLPKDIDPSKGHATFKGIFTSGSKTYELRLEPANVQLLGSKLAPELDSVVVQITNSDGSFKDERGSQIPGDYAETDPDFQTVVDNGRWLLKGYDNNPSYEEAQRRLK